MGFHPATAPLTDSVFLQQRTTIEDYLASQPRQSRLTQLGEYLSEEPVSKLSEIQRRGYLKIIALLERDLKRAEQQIVLSRGHGQAHWKGQCAKLQAQLVQQQHTIQQLEAQKDRLLSELRLRAGQIS